MAHKEARMVSQALQLKYPHHLLADDTQGGQNDEPGLVVENNHTTYLLMVYKKFKFR